MTSTNAKSAAQIALTGNAEYEKKRVENQTQINLVMDLQRYMPVSYTHLRAHET